MGNSSQKARDIQVGDLVAFAKSDPNKITSRQTYIVEGAFGDCSSSLGGFYITADDGERFLCSFDGALSSWILLEGYLVCLKSERGSIRTLWPLRRNKSGWHFVEEVDGPRRVSHRPFPLYWDSNRLIWLHNPGEVIGIPPEGFPSSWIYKGCCLSAEEINTIQKIS